MKLHHGNMWSAYVTADYFVFTGNSYIKTNGALVMGRGMAKQVRDKFPGIDIELGRLISKKLPYYYGFIYADNIGVLQVKEHYSQKAELDLIQHSIHILYNFAIKHKYKQIHMNYPGIGFGGLTKKQVSPIIKQLPDNVHIWTYKEKRKCGTPRKRKQSL